MTNDLTDNLFSLIKSLSPSEKRQFSLYVGRIGVNSDSKFLNLFKVLSKQKRYDEELADTPLNLPAEGPHNRHAYYIYVVGYLVVVQVIQNG